jgi:hypothetical protein
MNDLVQTQISVYKVSYYIGETLQRKSMTAVADSRSVFKDCEFKILLEMALLICSYIVTNEDRKEIIERGQGHNIEATRQL